LKDNTTIKAFLEQIGAKKFNEAEMYIENNLKLYMPWMCDENSKMSEVISFVRRKDNERKMGVMTLMLFPSSGKLGFGNYDSKGRSKGRVIDRDTLKKIYVRENELRLSNEVQEMMDRCVLSNMDEYANLVETIQRKVLKEFGYEEEDDLEVFRESLGKFTDDEEISSIPYYSKYNRANVGNLKVGDDMVDVKLTSIENPSLQTSLTSFYKEQIEKRNLKKDCPFVVIAGSIT